MHSRDEPFLRSLECYFGIYFPRNSGNKHQSNPLVSAETIRHSSKYIILYVSNNIMLNLADMVILQI